MLLPPFFIIDFLYLGSVNEFHDYMKNVSLNIKAFENLCQVFDYRFLPDKLPDFS
jgi:hypothetical protein